MRGMAAILELPRVYLLTTHLTSEEHSSLQAIIPSVTEDIETVELFVGKISKRERAEFELRRLNIHFRPLEQVIDVNDSAQDELWNTSEIITTRSDFKRLGDGSNGAPIKSREISSPIRVVKLSWLTDCIAQQKLLPYDNYLLFEGMKLSGQNPPLREKNQDNELSASQILQRASEDGGPGTANRASQFATRSIARGVATHGNTPSLLRRTTSEHEGKFIFAKVPDFLLTRYACQRPTPMTPPNNVFIEELKKIRTLRLLRGDKIGVRAYSTAIAAISAYPYNIQYFTEIEQLPGCSTRISEIYQQWSSNGQSTETLLATQDPKLLKLKLFYDIWGVGDLTARNFLAKGWRDLDDIVEYGWQSLSRIQQIGVKYYTEFKQGIPRQEVEDIASRILDHAREIDTGFEMTIVGGYRRGKHESGDVDVVLSHREEAKTLHMIEKLVLSLENADLITHTLSLRTKNSERGQLPLAWQGQVSNVGSGFDTLDKAMVVWQDKPRFGNSALHRRVDIIVSPWKTVGCALLGWSGETTFQRDLRRYCKLEKGFKFDSSGIRRRSDGKWMDFEGFSFAEHIHAERGGHSPAPDMETAEKRVFFGLGLQWRCPAERCTG